MCVRVYMLWIHVHVVCFHVYIFWSNLGVCNLSLLDEALIHSKDQK